MQKAFLAVQVLQVLTMGLGKLSLVALFSLLLSPSNLGKIILSISIALGLWTLSMIIATAAQCSTPNVWDLAYGSCIDVVSGHREDKGILLTYPTDCFMEILGCYQYPNRSYDVCDRHFRGRAPAHDSLDSSHSHRLLQCQSCVSFFLSFTLSNIH